jgi:hypothetical protein
MSLVLIVDFIGVGLPAFDMMSVGIGAKASTEYSAVILGSPSLTFSGWLLKRMI